MTTELIKDKWYWIAPYADKSKIWYIKFDKILNGTVTSSIHITDTGKALSNGGFSTVGTYVFTPVTDFKPILQYYPLEKIEEQVINNYELY